MVTNIWIWMPMIDSSIWHHGPCWWQYDSSSEFQCWQYDSSSEFQCFSNCLEINLVDQIITLMWFFMWKRRQIIILVEFQQRRSKYQVMKWLQVLSCLLLCNDGLQKPNQYLVLHRNLCSQGPELADTVASPLFVNFTISYPCYHPHQWSIND